MSALFSLIKSAGRRTIKLAVKTYYRAINFMPIWLALNREGISLQKKFPPLLDPVSKRTAEDLKKYGIAFVHINELFPSENKFGELLSYSQGLEKNAGVKTNKEFLQFYLDSEPMLDLKNPLIKLALEEKVLGIINSYMGMFSKFYMFTLNKTMPIDAGTKEIQSQRWHRDPEDKKMVKIFMYFNDVDEEAGPFVFVKESHFEGKFGNLFPPKPPLGSLPPDEGVRKAVSKENMHVCTAKAGTIIFADPRGIHKGGYATKKHRIMSTLYYSSKASPWPVRYKYPENFKKTLAETNFSPAQRFALDNFSRIGRRVYKF